MSDGLTPGGVQSVLGYKERGIFECMEVKLQSHVLSCCRMAGCFGDEICYHAQEDCCLANVWASLLVYMSPVPMVRLGFEHLGLYSQILELFHL